MRSLVKDHPFLDGNKRTAVVSTIVFLRINGYRLTAGKGELYRLALRVATSRDNEAVMRYLRRWLRKRIRRLPNRASGRPRGRVQQ
ncbi:MAG: type II toxin-antitoxin system death-on-curing family toxin [candidate division NC10 bacterium]|nr:type II toxin-antitoxin system death-on-curing family toxin [candidate division NC10 bacterium]